MADPSGGGSAAGGGGPGGTAGGDEPALKKLVEELPEELKKLDEMTLQLRLARAEEENEELRSKAAELQVKLDQQLKDKADIYYYLNKKLDDNYKFIAQLEAELKSLQDEKAEADETHEVEVTRMERQGREAMDELTQKVKEAQDKLKELASWGEEKETMVARLEELEATLEEERRAHEEKISELERRNFQEKERLKKEMLIKIKETKQNLLSKTEDQLHTTTKRTIMENEQMTTELQYQSKETEKLLRRNERLLAHNRELKREVALLQQSQEEMAKRSHFFRRLIKKLHEKLRMREEAERKTEEVTAEEMEKRDSELDDAHKTLSGLEETIATLETNLEEAYGELESTRGQLDDTAARYNRLMSLQDETLKFLFRVVTHVREKLDLMTDDTDGGDGDGGTARRPSSRDIASKLDDLSAVQREQVVKAFITKLHAYQQYMRDRGRMRDGGGSRAGGGGGGGGGGRAGFAPSLSMPGGGLPSIHAGRSPLASIGLGMSVDADDLLPSLTMAGDRPARPPMVSVAVQTESASKALFFADRLAASSAAPLSPTAASRPPTGTALLHVDGPVRPWGRRAYGMPLTMHGSGTFLRKRSGRPGPMPGAGPL